jgi:ATP-dependent helicase/nuclease subunit A
MNKRSDAQGIPSLIKEALIKNQKNMTAEQREAVYAGEEKNKNILISAAAGSGKTYVLVQRIIKLIAKDNKDIRKMLLATFTNAAASQMNKKIYDALSRLIYEDGIDSRHLREQITYLNGADIGTLHALCIKIIRNYFYAVDVPCDFFIIEGADEFLLRAEALQEVLEQFYEEARSDFLQLSDIYTTSSGIESLKEIILQAHDYAQSRPEGLTWLQSEIEYYNSCENLNKSKWADVLKNTYIQQLSQAKKLQHKAVELAESYIDEQSIAALAEEEQQIDRLLLSLHEGFDVFAAASKAYSIGRLAIPRCYKGEIKDEIKEARDAAKELVKNTRAAIGGFSLKKAEKENQKIYIILKALYSVVQAFDMLYTEKKYKRKAITFNDCEHYCLKILQTEDISQEIKNSYDYVFIDEYQDISILQEELLRKICKDDNLFMVGDVKQSIYRFRLAEADIFNRKYKEYRKENNENELIILNKNFRSSQNVINCVNAIFSEIMNKDSADIDYDDDAKLVFARTDGVMGDKTGIYLFTKCNGRQEIDGQTGQDNDVLDEINDYESAEIEAQSTIEIISKLLDTQVYDKKLDAKRNVTYGDIVILLASPNVDAPCYLDIFAQNNIPAFYDAGKDYFDNMEVNLMMSFLSVIDNDDLDIELIALMRAPFFDFKLSEMIQIRKEHQKGFFYEAVKAYIRCHSNVLSQKLAYFYEVIKSYREKSKYLSLYDLLYLIYQETGYYEYASLLEYGSYRRDNLSLLLNLAKKYEKNGGAGLFGFIRLVEKIKQSQVDQFAGTSVKQNGNAVRIMSIHKSKGLEFPIVILGRTSKRFNTDDIKKEIIYHKNLGIGATYYDMDLGYKCDSFAKTAVKATVYDEILAEQMRLLYVALTRAEEQLIITSLIDEDKLESRMKEWSRQVNSFETKKLNSFINFIMYAIMHKDCAYNKGIFNLIVQPSALNRAKTEKNFTKKQIFKLLQNNDAGELDREIKEQLNWRYKYENSLMIPQKTTVTELKQRAYASQKKTASFENIDENNISPLRKGVIVHYILQTVSLDVLKNAPHYETYLTEYVQHLMRENVISVQEQKSIDTLMLAKFFASDIGQKMLAAKDVQREVEFYYTIKANEIDENIQSDEKLYIQGVIDCIFSDEESTYILDYKTDTYYNDESKEDKIKTYTLQLQMYQRAYEEIMQAEQVKSVICFINMGENIIIDTEVKINE